MKNKSYKDRLLALHLPTLEKRRIFHDLVRAYNIITRQYGIDLSKIFISSDTSRLRGQALKLCHEKYKTRWRQYFLTNEVFTFWNSLDSGIFNSKTTTTFKHKLGRHLFHAIKKKMFYC